MILMSLKANWLGSERAHYCHSTASQATRAHRAAALSSRSRDHSGWIHANLITHWQIAGDAPRAFGFSSRGFVRDGYEAIILMSIYSCKWSLISIYASKAQGCFSICVWGQSFIRDNEDCDETLIFFILLKELFFPVALLHFLIELKLCQERKLMDMRRQWTTEGERHCLISPQTQIRIQS